MKEIQLTTMQDAITVFNNWHQDINLILEEMSNNYYDSNQDEALTAIQQVRLFVAESPFKCDVYINQEIMHSNAETIEYILND